MNYISNPAIDNMKRYLKVIENLNKHIAKLEERIKQLEEGKNRQWIT